MMFPRSSTFRRLWVGQTFSVIGDGMQRVALVWWAKTHGGATTVTAVSLAATFPLLIGSSYGGALADRWDRFHLLLASDSFRLASSCALALIIGSRFVTTLTVSALIIVTSAATSIFDPTHAALVPDIVSSEELATANGVNLAKSAGGTLIGPIVGGIALTVSSVQAVFAINAVSFAVSILCIYYAYVCHQSDNKPRTDPMANAHDPQDLGGTWRLIRTVPGLSRLIALPAMLNGAVGPLSVLMIVLATDKLHLSPAGYGALQSCLGLGLFVGALTSGRLVRGRGLFPLVVVAVSFAVTSVASTPVTASALLVCGFAIAIASTEFETAFQLVTPLAERGRVFGMAEAFSHALRPLGILAAAPMIGLLGVDHSLLVVSTAILIPSLIWGRGDLLPQDSLSISSSDSSAETCRGS
jgi:predicted MFS family arabinose efflux permease